MLALFESLGGIELVVVGIGALLLFGKDLPKVAGEAGAQIAKFKRSLDATWRDTGLERELRQFRDVIPRDLSLRDVARTASEKLAVRLDDEERTRICDPAEGGPVPRGATIHDKLVQETVPEPKRAEPEEIVDRTVFGAGVRTNTSEKVSAPTRPTAGSSPAKPRATPPDDEHRSSAS